MKCRFQSYHPAGLPTRGVETHHHGGMPTYTVRTATGRLDPALRRRLAEAITAAHTDATGAQAFFAQVVFEEVDAERHFVAGRPVADEMVFVHGQIRAGRTDEQRSRLLEGVVGAVVEVVGVERRAVWAYLIELPASNMVEYGRVLPPPGGEAAWLAALESDEQGQRGV